MKKTLLAVIIGSALGVIGAKVLFVGSGLSLLVWGAAGLAIGWMLAVSAREAAGLGASYGFALAFVFMLAGYNGADPVAGKFGFFAVLGIVGAICGLAAALVGLGMKVLWGKWH